MITVGSGDLLQSTAMAHVNAVNTVGTMGAGIARQFRDRYPAMYADYQHACRLNLVRIGEMWIFDRGASAGRPRWIINFPTKRHWRQPSALTYIQQGLDDLVRQVRRLGVNSIAIPALGCQNGGLSWDAVEPLIRGAFEPLACVDVQLYSPQHWLR